MALLDLSSDLSRYRAESSRDEKNTPEASKATNNKNFATVQPITEKLAMFSAQTIKKPEKIKKLENKLGSTKLDNIKKPKSVIDLGNKLGSTKLDDIKKPKPIVSLEDKLSSTKLDDIKKPKPIVSLEDKLSSTKLDDIKKIKPEGMLINTVSKYSPNIIREDLYTSRLTTREVVSNLDKLQKKESNKDNITNPNVKISPSKLTFDRSKSTAKIVIKRDDAKDNITNPNITINKSRLTYDRTKSLAQIIVKKNDTSDNITNPNTTIIKKPLTVDRKKQTPNIVKDTIKEGLVVNPNINVIRVEQGKFHLEDESNLNPDGAPIKFVTDSKLVNKKPKQSSNNKKYNGVSQQTTDNSNLNLDAVVKTKPSGRNEDPGKSKFSIVGVQQVNFFTDNNAKGFVVKAKKGETLYKEGSEFSWKGKTPPTTNFMPDVNAKGFQSFAKQNETAYNTNSSKFGFSNPLEVDFFDKNKQYTVEGFKKFVAALRTAYKLDASVFGWKGKRNAAPEVNYFDKSTKNTTAGFHKFAQILDTKYKTDSSVFDWDGKKEKAPEVNYFDVGKSYTTAGFHKFAQILDTKYIPESSIFDWDGKRTESPEVNYFDITSKNTTAGFHKFAQIYDTKYVPESSVFDWDGARASAPFVNYFDVTGKNTTAGFHNFAQIYDTKYVAESSIFDWDGTRPNAPFVNYFDVTGKNTTAGFHTFAQIYDTKYVPESSIFDWDGAREAAPHVDYFDITKKNTTAGFHNFAQIYDTKYVPESSIFDWDGKRPDAPHVDYFDITKRNTTEGFHTFAQIYDTKYVPESSIFDWDGKRPDAPHVDYFDITKKNTTAGFHTFAQIYDTKYVPESSIFDWDGKRPDAPHVDYFDISKKNTSAGFHTFAQIYDTKYVSESSIFDWDGKRPDAPHVDYFDITKKNTTEGFHTFAQIYDTKYVPESSIFDWDGGRSNAPYVDYFDITKKNTTVGFHTFAQVYDSKYVKESSIFDWDGGRSAAPESNYFDIQKKYTSAGFHRLAELYDSKYVKEASKFDWNGGRKAAPGVNYFDIQKKYTSDGFHTLAELYDTKYVKDASKFDWDGARTAAPTTNFFADDKSKGFTKLAEKLKSEYTPDASDFTFKGSLPTPVDFFINDASAGFTNKMPALESLYNKDASKFTFKGSTPDPVDFFPNDAASGFDNKVALFDSKYKKDISVFTFKGTKQNAKEENYFLDTYAKGFTNFVGALETKYVEKPTAFGWPGARSDAPSVDFFKIPGSNPNAIEGFNTLFDDKTKTKYSDKLSLFSIESSAKKSSTKDVPYTTFFGYNLSERTGFMVNMTTFDGTLFPIIDPVLKFDASPSDRIKTSIIRGENPAALKTVLFEKYAPLSLGKRPWANGTIFSTLENQIENPVTHSPGGSYIKKYESTMVDNTDKLGYLTKWATTRRSPSPLDKQYLKYKLQDEAVNNEAAAFNQPYVVRGIQRRGEVDNQRWGFGINLDEGLTRGGVVTQAERILQDVFRIGKWSLSVRGLLFNIKQLGLQFMNPNVDKDPSTTAKVLRVGLAGISPTQFYNPLTMIANIATARAGMHLPRHGLIPFQEDFLNKYEKATINREASLDLSSREYTSFEKVDDDSNRLIGLTKELLPMTFSPKMRQENLKSASQENIEKLKKIFDNLKELAGKSKIDRLSSSVFGGPQSLLGIGGTAIRRASHPYLVSYNTAPDLFNDYNQPKYTEESKRETFYSATEPYSNTGDRVKQYSAKSSGKLSRDIENLYQTLLVTGSSPTNTVDKGILLQNGVTETIISKFSGLEPKHQLQSDRYKASNNIPTDKPISEGYHPDDANIKDPLDKLKRYRVLSYGKLGKPSENTPGRSRFFNDFRHDLQLSGSEAFITNPKIARYETRNLENFYGLGRHGEPGAQRNVPYVTNVEYNVLKAGINSEVSKNVAANPTKLAEANKYMSYPVPKLKKGHQFRGDRINIIDYKRANFNITRNLVYEKGEFGDTTLPGSRDLIDFYFTSLVLSGHNYCPAEVIVFRAIFDNIQDSHNPSWNSVKYMGRADPLYVYQSYERSISFGFTVHIGSRDEMKATWRKLNYLASWTAPEYTKFGGFIRGPMCRLNIGNLFRKMPGYISSLSYTFDNTNGYWETAGLYEDQRMDGKDAFESTPGVLQLPKTIQVACSFTPVGVYRPEKNGIMYSLYEDTGNPENGLIPHDARRVNYFNIYPDKPPTDPGNINGYAVTPGQEDTALSGSIIPTSQGIQGNEEEKNDTGNRRTYGPYQPMVLAPTPVAGGVTQPNQFPLMTGG